MIYNFIVGFCWRWRPSPSVSKKVFSFEALTQPTPWLLLLRPSFPHPSHLLLNHPPNPSESSSHSHHSRHSKHFYIYIDDNIQKKLSSPLSVPGWARASPSPPPRSPDPLPPLQTRPQPGMTTRTPEMLTRIHPRSTMFSREIPRGSIGGGVAAWCHAASGRISDMIRISIAGIRSGSCLVMGNLVIRLSPLIKPMEIVSLWSGSRKIR